VVPDGPECLRLIYTRLSDVHAGASVAMIVAQAKQNAEACDFLLFTYICFHWQPHSSTETMLSGQSPLPNNMFLCITGL
jgi:hypothetical protein